jgi:hypothetical protein
MATHDFDGRHCLRAQGHVLSSRHDPIFRAPVERLWIAGPVSDHGHIPRGPGRRLVGSEACNSVCNRPGAR